MCISLIGTLSIILCVICFTLKQEFKISAIIIISFVVISSLLVVLDINKKMTDEEVWSGRIIDVVHKEEYTEHIPAETITKKDSDGHTYTETIPSRDIYHESENKVETTDNGWIEVDKSPTGDKFNDDFPNTKEELGKIWKIGTPTSSVHRYINKVQCSYSIYKHKEIELDEYKDLPDYPKEIENYIILNRIIGFVPNKAQAEYKLREWNSELNKIITDSKTGKKRSWKQVNIIFVNVGENKTKDCGFALQDKWENGNKNDFVICFSMNKDGVVNWVYPFSWSESEKLKVEVRNYFEENKQIKNFEKTVNDICAFIRDGFERKQFAEFDYLQVEVEWYIKLIIIILAIICMVITII